MNLLITNPQEIQAYVILRSLRPVARRIILAEGSHSIGNSSFEGMATHSRFVDARHAVPGFADDWLAGRLEPGNTEAEEAYVRRIEEICRLERVDVIFPSLDPEVYLFAKNKERFLQQGVVTVVPDPEVIRVPMDKALTMKVAQRVGFPIPRTFYPESASDIARVIAESEPPWIVKPRFTAHGQKMAYASSAAELEAAYAQVSGSQLSPIVQEFLPGSLRQNYYVTVDRDGRLVSLLSPRATRTHDWGVYRVSTKTAVSASNAPYLEQMRVLLRELGLWGGYTIQTKVDPRDGIPKLLEINARLGQHVWWRTGLGVNEPMICLQIARGETPTGDFRFREGVMLLDPYFDLFEFYPHAASALFNVARRLVRRGGDSPQGTAEPGQPGVRSLLRAYARDYLNLKPKVFCPEFSSLLSDPKPCLRAYWFKFRPITAGHVQRIAVGLKRLVNRAA